MNLLSFLSITIGLILLLAILADIFVTVFVIGGGAGPQSGWVADRAWRLALRVHNPASKLSHSIMRGVGPAILLLALLLWVLELTLCWSLIFVSEAFIAPSGGVNFGDRVMFAAQTIIGRGGNRPPLETVDGVWEFAHSIAGLTGVMIVSLGLAYVLPILGAVAHKRSIAAQIHTLGANVDEMRKLAREGLDETFNLHLIALTPAVALSAERHRSYPVLHYFHSSQPHASLAPAVAKIALLMNEDMPNHNPAAVTPLGRSLQDLLGALENMGLGKFAEDKCNMKSDAVSEVGIEPLEKDQRPIPTLDWFRAYVQFDGWNWEEVASGDSANDPQLPAK